MKGLPPEGLWISPEGKKIRVVEHLITIAHYPEKFGITDRQVEGKSISQLREIADDLIRDGWVRYRHFGDSYNFEVVNAKRKIETIEDVLTLVDAYTLEKVYIAQAEPRKDFTGTVEDVFERRIFGYQENPKRKNRWRFT
jgi:hypothetical protein